MIPPKIIKSTAATMVLARMNLSFHDQRAPNVFQRSRLARTIMSRKPLQLHQDQPAADQPVALFLQLLQW